MSLTNVWVQTQADGLVRADQITGIDAHRTPALSGKPSRWLVDVVLPTPIGSGNREGWSATTLHRTLVQTPDDPGEAPAALARLLAQLDLVDAAGLVLASRDDRGSGPASGADGLVAGTGPVRFRFVPFADPATGDDAGPEYL